MTISASQLTKIHSYINGSAERLASLLKLIELENNSTITGDGFGEKNFFGNHKLPLDITDSVFKSRDFFAKGVIQMVACGGMGDGPTQAYITQLIHKGIECAAEADLKSVANLIAFHSNVVTIAANSRYTDRKLTVLIASTRNELAELLRSAEKFKRKTETAARNFDNLDELNKDAQIIANQSQSITNQLRHYLAGIRNTEGGPDEDRRALLVFITVVLIGIVWIWLTLPSRRYAEQSGGNSFFSQAYEKKPIITKTG